MTAYEILKVYDALRLAKRLAKEIGTDLDYAQMVEAYSIMGAQPLPSVFASQSERDSAYMNSFADQCATYGAD
jgi:hypothetical protein